MLVKIVDQIPDDEMHKAAWELYEGAFKDLRALAVQRHLMYRSEFDEVMRDPRVDKYLCLDDGGRLCGLSTFTNDLSAVPLIAPEYFERRWPDLYHQRKIYYVGFAAVGTDARDTRAFAELVEAMHRTASDRNGMIAIDYCRYNDDERNFGRVVRLMLRRLSGGALRAECMDQQSFWIYEFPAAA
ncbi:hypothetical protein [Actinoplanes teichomyceticus]|uniref:Acetyltransferase (GNAT) family protein n=1 Tax=Actinoplanes teichomyceticus TaxID=1867 RepID=A0A561VG99_ACTTI|nr:hypothetical protein [Actinoplanes teichomyceticus]TWG10652.1 hypothetical protein FHX34_107144 [Actinoplanes teichomyceticus]GIF15422.1 hypothetical protein Ate01nite_54540 [Actinoplanes teichomyceticus]